MITELSTQKEVDYFTSKLEFTIDPVRLHEEIKNGNVNIIDVRDEQSYKEGHIPGAINLPESRWETLRGLVRGKPNVVYCYSITCMLATRACKYFSENEYPVMELFGGFAEWKNHADYPIER